MTYCPDSVDLSLSSMELHRPLSYTFVLLFLFLIAGEAVCADGHDQSTIKLNNRHTDAGFRPTKLFVFGDSYSDTGNNPRSLASSWKIPYGISFPGKPAGRYSDGRVLTDYVGEAVCADEHDQSTIKLNNRHTDAGFRPTKLFVFGDSYSDTGNNPRSLASSWKIPYGISFPGKPAGRYSDGRVLTDYVARFMGIKSPLPYKFRKYGPGKLWFGLNFAYGGTGVFDTGNLQPNMTTQIGFLQGLIKDRVYTTEDLKSSLALVTVSGNDYSAYLSTGGSDQGLPSFISRVVNQMAINLKLIHDTGVRRVLVTTLQPIGCLPGQTVFSSYQQCNESQNALSSLHNQLLQQVVTLLNNTTKRSSFLTLDLFSSFNSVLTSKRDITGNSRFDTPLKPCCVATSSGANCGSLDENGKELYTVCNEPESMFFWDTVHPTQAGWHAVYLSLRSSLNRIYY